ncbi:hypothetical protein PR048_021998 [Dryococelus australis]|uniref:Uncharacterized protein n=1 Tax=Dryococelus australis TaxID=614101 RepID=A0ABQ9GZS9_9NEOP|nr:hypothetical protein PR048_021998 [Dryococelus australis]
MSAAEHLKKRPLEMEFPEQAEVTITVQQEDLESKEFFTGECLFPLQQVLCPRLSLLPCRLLGDEKHYYWMEEIQYHEMCLK